VSDSLVGESYLFKTEVLLLISELKDVVVIAEDAVVGIAVFKVGKQDFNNSSFVL
jgi:hypothetical protein